MVAAPPLELLRSAVTRLERAGIEVALGGSGLLAALSLADRVRDWDLTTEAPEALVIEALAGDPFVRSGNDALHADAKLAYADGALEVILGFAFFTPAGVVRIPTLVSERRDGIPLGSPEAWAVAYHLLGREAKTERLLEHLARTGVRSEARDRLLAQPLARDLAARLSALPTSSTT